MHRMYSIFTLYCIILQEFTLFTSEQEINKSLVDVDVLLNAVVAFDEYLVAVISGYYMIRIIIHVNGLACMGITINMI